MAFWEQKNVTMGLSACHLLKTSLAWESQRDVHWQVRMGKFCVLMIYCVLNIMRLNYLQVLYLSTILLTSPVATDNFLCVANYFLTNMILWSRALWSCGLKHHILNWEVGGSNLDESLSFSPGHRLDLTYLMNNQSD